MEFYQRYVVNDPKGSLEYVLSLMSWGAEAISSVEIMELSNKFAPSTRERCCILRRISRSWMHKYDVDLHHNLKYDANMRHKTTFLSQPVTEAVKHLGSRLRIAARQQASRFLNLKVSTRTHRTTLGGLERGRGWRINWNIIRRLGGFK